jgi:hypothetical protein
MTRHYKHPLIGTLLILSAGFAVLMAPMVRVNADTMTFVSDLITNSIPGELSNHTITFTPTSAVPVSGKIVVTFQANGISIPATMSYADLDLEVNSVQRDLAAAPGSGAGSPVGVVVTTGTSGQLVFTLNDTNNISAGSVIRVTMGNNATHQVAGINPVTNGAAIGSYTVDISTRTAANAYIDVSQAIFVLVQGVGLSVETPTPTPSSGGGGGGPTPSPTPLSGIGLWPDAGPNPDAFGSRLLDPVPVSAPEVTIGAVLNASMGRVQLGVDENPVTFTTQSGVPAASVIAAGAWEFTTYAIASPGSGQTSLIAGVYVRAPDGTERLLFEHVITNNLGSTATEHTTSTYQPEYTLDRNEQLVLRYFVETTSPSTVTATLYYQGENRYSHVLSPPYYTPTPSCFRIADFNDDCRVNITDFSILMANWGPNPRNIRTDINLDSLAGIIDLSILLYWWTG